MDCVFARSLLARAEDASRFDNNSGCGPILGLFGVFPESFVYIFLGCSSGKICAFFFLSPFFGGVWGCGVLFSHSVASV